MLSQFFSIVIMLSMLGAGALEANTSDVVTVNPTATYIGPAGPALGLFVACIIGSIFASLLVVNRIYWRLKLAGGLGYDDWAVIFALVSTRPIIMLRSSDTRPRYSFSHKPSLSSLPSSTATVQTPGSFSARTITVHLALGTIKSRLRHA
jgi:hypothetical protein